MKTEITDSLLIALMETIRLCADTFDLNGPAFYMLAQEIVELDRPLAEITLGELAAAYERAGVRYNRMEERLAGLGVKG